MLATAAFGEDGPFDIVSKLRRDTPLRPSAPLNELPKFGGGAGIADAVGKVAPHALLRLQERIENAELWRWQYPSGQVREIRNITCRARTMHKMAATVCDKIVFHELRVKLFGEAEHVLPLESRFEVGRLSRRTGEIPGSSSGLWQLRAKTDSSFMNVLAYRLEPSGWEPMTREELVDAGDEAMPTGDLVEHFKFKFTGQNVVTGKVAKPRLVVVLSLVCCKERNDCEPSESLGAARIYPQVMVMGNVNVERVEATIEMWRPSTSMHAEHDPDGMQSNIESLVFTDTNMDHTAGILPVPRWDEIFDYYHLDPHRFLANRQTIAETAPEGTLPGELCFVDREALKRTIPKAVSRFDPDFEGDPTMLERELERRFYGNVQDILKLEGQGEFDNLHVAPQMRQAFEIAKTAETGPALQYLDDIAMAPFCVHDCLHTHLRWGDLKLPPGLTMPKSNRGWHGGQPYSRLGAPLVPSNQSVYVSMPAKHAFRYRAVAHNAFAGTWTVFNHHGSYYATGEWPGAANVALEGAKVLIDHAVDSDEPWTDDSWGALPSPADSWSALYWRLRWGGYQNPDNPQRNHAFERLTFNLARCMR